MKKKLYVVLVAASLALSGCSAGNNEVKLETKPIETASSLGSSDWINLASETTTATVAETTESSEQIDTVAFFDGAIKALKDFDIEGMKKYYPYRSAYYDILAENMTEADIELWKQVFSTLEVIYYYDYSNKLDAQVCMKSPTFMYALWYTDNANSEAGLGVSSTENIDTESALAIYNQYIGSTPVASSILMRMSEIVTESSEFGMQVSYDKIMDYFFQTQLADLIFVNNIGGILVLGEHESLDLGYNYHTSSCSDELFAAIRAYDISAVDEVLTAELTGENGTKSKSYYEDNYGLILDNNSWNDSSILHANALGELILAIPMKVEYTIPFSYDKRHPERYENLTDGCYYILTRISNASTFYNALGCLKENGWN